MNPALRRTVRERARGRCEYCLLPDLLPSLIPFHCEHIRPRRHGGTDEVGNLAWSCARCNERKDTHLGAEDPDTGKLERLFNPRADRWQDHFEFDGIRILGRGPVGRATIWLLEMNHERRLELRALLRKMGYLG
jgi:hypothetical protein